MVRYKYVNEAKLFAFELVDLKTDSAYLVPFDLNDTRLTALGDITPAWMDHYFNWNGEKLALRKNQKPLPWQGSLKAATYGHFAYDLQPITPGMPSVFMKFLVDRFGVMADPSQATADIITNLSIKGQSFTFSYYKKSNRIVLEGEYGSPEAMTLQIAQDFNRELMNERNQAFFTKLNPQGFSR